MTNVYALLTILFLAELFSMLYIIYLLTKIEAIKKLEVDVDALSNSLGTLRKIVDVHRKYIHIVEMEPAVANNNQNKGCQCARRNKGTA